MEEKDHVSNLEKIIDLILDGIVYSDDIVGFNGLSKETCDWILDYYYKNVRGKHE